jgi:hypothetical protein
MKVVESWLAAGVLAKAAVYIKALALEWVARWVARCSYRLISGFVIIHFPVKMPRSFTKSGVIGLNRS